MIRELRGSIELTQLAGQGCRFHLQVPLTLSVVRSLVVEVGARPMPSRSPISSAR